MEYIKLYIKSKIRLIAVIIICCVIFGVVFYLTDLPLKAVLYPMLLCMIVFAAAASLNIRRTIIRHSEMKSFLTDPSDLSELMLPESHSVEDEDYKALVCALISQKDELINRMNTRYDEMNEYYTVWAHQIKTPIASMRLNLQNEDSPSARQLKSDLFSIERYVEMELAYFRLDSPSTDYLFKQYNLDDIVKQSVKLFAGEFILRNISLDYTPLNISVVTDEKWLSFVFEQLISNALKYTPSGSISVYADGESAMCIKDTGIGIASEDLPRVFEKGYTGCNGRADKKASGIGLYLCKKICTALGHGISITSAPGQGTLVRLDFNQNNTVFD